MTPSKRDTGSRGPVGEVHQFDPASHSEFVPDLVPDSANMTPPDLASCDERSPNLRLS
jgi:hypothetical protein